MHAFLIQVTYFIGMPTYAGFTVLWAIRVSLHFHVNPWIYMDFHINSWISMYMYMHKVFDILHGKSDA